MMRVTGVKREALVLMTLVLAVDAVFVAGYFLTRIRNAPDGVKLAFTALWTLVTLAVVVRGLSRIRVASLGQRSSSSSSHPRSSE